MPAAITSSSLLCRGRPSAHRDYGGQRHIVHYSSDDLDKWKFEQRVPVSSDYCIDPTLCRRPDGEWWMWFKDERHDSETRGGRQP